MNESGGFSLVELLVTLAVVTMALAVAVPMLASSGGVGARAAAGAIAGALRETREAAMSAGVSQRLVIDVARRRFLAPGSDVFRSLPGEVSLVLFTARSELEADRVGAIRFYRDGSSSGGRVTVRAAARSLAVDVDWLTGRVRVSEVLDPHGYEPRGAMRAVE